MTTNHVTQEEDFTILTEKDLKVRQLKNHIEWLTSRDSRLGKNTMGLIKYYSNKLKQLNKLK